MDSSCQSNSQYNLQSRKPHQWNHLFLHRTCGELAWSLSAESSLRSRHDWRGELQWIENSLTISCLFCHILCCVESKTICYVETMDVKLSRGRSEDDPFCCCWVCCSAGKTKDSRSYWEVSPSFSVEEQKKLRNFPIPFERSERFTDKRMNSHRLKFPSFFAETSVSFRHILVTLCCEPPPSTSSSVTRRLSGCETIHVLSK